MKVIDDFAYIVSEAPGHGLQVFDLTQLQGLSEDSERLFNVSAHLNNFGQAHNIVANPALQRVYVVGSYEEEGFGNCAGGSKSIYCMIIIFSDILLQILFLGLHVIDVSDPLNPESLSCNGDDEYIHDAECFTYDGPDQRYVVTS